MRFLRTGLGLAWSLNLASCSSLSTAPTIVPRLMVFPALPPPPAIMAERLDADADNGFESPLAFLDDDTDDEEGEGVVSVAKEQNDEDDPSTTVIDESAMAAAAPEGLTSAIEVIFWWCCGF